MRVLHICPQFSPLSETFIYGYVTEMERQGVDGHVLTWARINAPDRPFPKVRVVPKPGRWHPGHVWRRVMASVMIGDRDEAVWPTVRRRMRRELAVLRPDVIHAHFGAAGTIVGPVAASLGIPLIVTFYGQDISGILRTPAWRIRYAQLWPRTAAVTVLSEHMGARARELGCPAAKVNVVHLGCAIAPLPVRERGPVRRFLIVGRLVEKKGHVATIQAFARSIQRYPDLRLDIVGEGPLRAPIEQAIRDCGVQDCARLHGERSNPEVLGMMATTDAFISCSVTASDGDEEGTPTVLIEAQAKGLPCVATLHAGIPEVIAPENHWLLAPEGDVSAIADRIERLVRQPPVGLEPIVAAGWRHVQARFNLTTESARLVRLFDSVRKVRSSDVMPGPKTR